MFQRRPKPELQPAHLGIVVVCAVIAIICGLIAIADPAGGPSEASASASANNESIVKSALSAAGAILARSAQPPATKTPNAPGITIASLREMDMPDPFMLTVGKKYYLYFSSAYGNSSNIPVMSGTPGHWGPVSDAMPKVPSWALPATAGVDTWDPYVVHVDGKFIMYAAAPIAERPPADAHANDVVHCLLAAVSSSPAGPFVAVGDKPLICQTTLGGDIDSQLFFDPEGPRGPDDPYYLIWKSDNNNLPGSGPTTIWAAPMSNDGLSFGGRARPIFKPDLAWEMPVLEAPQMVLAPDGTDWLFFSAGSGYYTSRYAMGYLKCNGPLAGCHEVTAGPIISSNAQGPGPGEETVFVAPDGTTWLLYSPYHSAIAFEPVRPVEAARIGWNASGPFVAQAGAFPLPG